MFCCLYHLKNSLDFSLVWVFCCCCFVSFHLIYYHRHHRPPPPPCVARERSICVFIYLYVFYLFSSSLLLLFSFYYVFSVARAPFSIHSLARSPRSFSRRKGTRYFVNWQIYIRLIFSLFFLRTVAKLIKFSHAIPKKNFRRCKFHAVTLLALNSTPRKWVVEQKEEAAEEENEKIIINETKQNTYYHQSHMKTQCRPEINHTKCKTPRFRDCETANTVSFLPRYIIFLIAESQIILKKKEILLLLLLLLFSCSLLSVWSRCLTVLCMTVCIANE